jgi:hypothetical protein
MLAVFTLVVAGVPHRYSADSAPAISEVVALDDGGARIRIVRSADGGRVFVGELVSDPR